jgi:hypothetical protein
MIEDSFMVVPDGSDSQPCKGLRVVQEGFCSLKEHFGVEFWRVFRLLFRPFRASDKNPETQRSKGLIGLNHQAMVNPTFTSLALLLCKINQPYWDGN